MPWIRIDEAFDEHPKFAAASPLGIALWLAGLAYCNRNLTDGRIPWAAARSLLAWEYLGPPDEDGRRRHYTIGVTCGMGGEDVDCPMVIDLLLEAGLWEQIDGGYQVHDYLEYQPSRTQVEAERSHLHAVRSAAGRRGGARSAEARRSKNGSKPEATTNTNEEQQQQQNGTPVPVTHGEHHGVPAMVPEEEGVPAIHAHAAAARRRVRAPAPTDLFCDDFDAFWAIYPRHESKKSAAIAYRARRDAGRTPEQLLAAARHFAQTHEIRSTPIEKIPYATRFLTEATDEEWERGPPDQGRRGAPFRDDRSASEKALEPVRVWREINAEGRA